MAKAIHTITHFVYPTFSNNHKAKFIQTSSIVFLSFFLVAFQIFVKFVPVSGFVLGYAANISVSEVINLTNQKRMENGLSPLSSNTSLNQAAEDKVKHMFANNYWSHVAPDGTEPWKFFIDSEYRYRYAGENLARDFSSANLAIDAWMASASHRDNMLSGKYDEIGIAVMDGNLNGTETTIIVQLFGKRLESEPRLALDTSMTELTVVETTPTFFPTQAPEEIEEEIPNTVIVSGTNVGDSVVIVSPLNTSKAISLSLVTALLGVMVVDGVAITSQKIPRRGGKILAHIAFLSTIIVVILIIKAGNII